MRLGQTENGQAFGHIGFEPGAEFGRGPLPFFDDGFESLFGFKTIVGVEDGAQIAGDVGALFQFGNQGLSVALQMKLASLPG